MKRPEPPPTETPASFLSAISYLQANRNSEALQVINDRYLYWSEVKYRAKAWGLEPLTLWFAAKTLRNGNSQKILVSATHKLELSFSLPTSLLKDLHELDLNCGGMLQTGQFIAAEFKQQYLISSIMEEAISSSQLEGAATSRKVAKEMLREQRKPRDHSERMILNNYRTIQYIAQCKDQSLSPALLRSIQLQITKNALEHATDEGAFRTSDDVHVVDTTDGETLYIPPLAAHVEQLVSDLCNFANDETNFVHPFVKASLLHFLIGYIHPFADGNGRTARAVFYWFLLKKGYWLMEYLSISRIVLKSIAQYSDAYQFSELDGNDVTYFLKYKLKVTQLAFQALKLHLQRKASDRAQLFEFTTLSGINTRQAILLKEISQDNLATLTVKKVAHMFDVVHQTARTDLLELEAKGLLTSKLDGKALVFYRSPNFDKQLQKLKQAHA